MNESEESILTNDCLLSWWDHVLYTSAQGNCDLKPQAGVEKTSFGEACSMLLPISSSDWSRYQKDAASVHQGESHYCGKLKVNPINRVQETVETMGLRAFILVC